MDEVLNSETKFKMTKGTSDPHCPILPSITNQENGF